jgi:hypothetical protein
VTEGTWALPRTLEQKKKLNTLMSQELIVGPDAINATEQLYDLVGDDVLFDILDDIAMTDPDANAWDDARVQKRMAELGIEMPTTQPTNETLMGAPAGAGAAGLQPTLSEESKTFELVKVQGAPDEGDIHEIGSINFKLLPGASNLRIDREGYSDTLYYRDPVSGGTFSFYYAYGAPRIRGTSGMDEGRVEEIVQTLESGLGEDLDTDGVMMTRPSNMSSESVQRTKINRLFELGKI